MSNASNGVSYAEARDQIKTGDLIAVRSLGGVLSAITRAVTRSPYTHTGIALWESGRLLLVETRGVAALVPLSQYRDGDFDVIDCPVDREAAYLLVYHLLGRTISYDFMDLLRIAAHELLGVPLPDADDELMICSALSAAIYKAAGWQPAGLPSLPAPRDVVRAAGRVSIEVRIRG